MEDTRIVLCGANAYEQKYYFNEKFNGIPQSIKDELHVISVLFTEEVGGVFTIVFEEDGSISLETNAEESDLLYDEISSGLLVGKSAGTDRRCLRPCNCITGCLFWGRHWKRKLKRLVRRAHEWVVWRLLCVICYGRLPSAALHLRTISYWRLWQG